MQPNLREINTDGFCVSRTEDKMRVWSMLRRDLDLCAVAIECRICDPSADGVGHALGAQPSIPSGDRSSP